MCSGAASGTATPWPAWAARSSSSCSRARAPRQAVERAEEIRRDCAGLEHVLGGETVTVTISAGVASGPLGGAASDALLDAADRALYAAKAAGRNRVVAAPAGPGWPPAPAHAPVDELLLGR